MDANIIACQCQIVANLQEKLLDAVSRGDWSATDNWGKFLNSSVQTLSYLNQEDFMELKDKIQIFEKAIADRDALIANLQAEIEKLKSEDASDKSQITALSEGDKAADKLLAKLGSPKN